MTEGNGQQPEQPEPFIPDGQYAAQALREQLNKERQEHRAAIDAEVDRSTYLRATLLQLQEEATREIGRRDAVVQSQATTIEQLRTELQISGPAGQQPTGDVLEPPEGQDTEEDACGLDTVSWEQPTGYASNTRQSGGNPENLTPEKAWIERDAGLTRIPDAPDGLEPDPELVPAGVDPTGGPVPAHVRANDSAEVPLHHFFGKHED